MAKSVRRAQSKKARSPRANKTRDFRGGVGDFPTLKGPRYSRKAKYSVEY
jgi:hypothetical protein